MQDCDGMKQCHPPTPSPCAMHHNTAEPLISLTRNYPSLKALRESEQRRLTVQDTTQWRVGVMGQRERYSYSDG